MKELDTELHKYARRRYYEARNKFVIDNSAGSRELELKIAAIEDATEDAGGLLEEKVLELEKTITRFF